MKGFLPFAHYRQTFFMHYNEFLRLLCRTCSLVLCFLPLAFWILLVFSLESPCSAVITVVCALIHEMGHIIFIFRKTGRIRLPEGRLNGFLIRERGTALMSYREEAMLYLSGPLANICTAALSLILSPLIGDYAVFISVISLVTGISSLLPIEGYDGYGMLSAIVQKWDKGFTGQALLKRLSSALTFLFCN